MSMLDDIVALDERNQLYLSAAIADWSRVHKHDITAVIDLDAGRGARRSGREIHKIRNSRRRRGQRSGTPIASEDP